jgi:predicted RNase H-like nuclease (RuvC/YqgF family)
MPNLNFIKEHGVKQFIEQQEKRIKLLETMIDDFDDGRSRSFFCRAAALLSLNSLESSLDKATQKIKTGDIEPNDIKIKARILKGLLNEAGFKEGIELKLRTNS